MADTSERFGWTAKITVEKFWGEHIEGQTPYEVIETDNLAMYGGISALWQCLIGNGTASTGQALTYFSSSNAAIGVGDSNTTASATQTNLQASSNKLRKGMNGGYPSHTDATSSGAATIQFQATFGTSEANFAWNEIGVFNSTSDGTGRMLNRKVESLGTKTSSSSWQVTVSLTMA